MAKSGPKCGKCGGSTRIHEWGDRPVNRVTYCNGCNNIAGRSCTCKSKKELGRKDKR